MKTHSMLKSLKEMTGNPRLCVLTEPLWGIPHSLYVPYASVYMLAMGITDVQIGIVVSLTLFLRAVTAAFSGAVTDKLGRRRATVIFDIISWSVPCFLWACAQNIWWFYAAAVFNGFWQITENSWTCLLVEDADKSKMVSIYNWIYVSGQLSVFFAPLSSLLVGQMTIIPAMRILYFFSFLSMTAKFLILYKYGDETERGKLRMKQTKNQSLFSLLAGYKELIPRFFSSANLRLAMGISILFTATSTVMDSFFGVYTTQVLLLPDHYLSIFPIIRSAIMLVFIFIVQPRISHLGFKGPMLVGVGIYVISELLLILMPGIVGIAQGWNLLVPIVYTVIQACAQGLVMPRKDSITALCLDMDERARMNSILMVMVLGVNIPFGYLAGFLSNINRSLPFVLNIALFATAFVVIFSSRKLAKGGELRAQ